MSHVDPAIPIETLLEHRAWVRTLARALVFDENRAADLEQQVWLETLRKPPGRADSPRGWLATVLRRAAAKMARTDTRRMARESSGPSRFPVCLVLVPTSAPLRPDVLVAYSRAASQ